MASGQRQSDNSVKPSMRRASHSRMTSKKGGQITMTGNSDNSNTQPQQPPTPNPELKRLERLVGTWKVFGPEIDGQVTFEWLDGGFFLVQRFDLDHNGHNTK